MTGTRTLTLLLVVLIAPALGAESLGDCPEYHDGRVRTTDARLRSLIDEGIRSSATFEALVDRLTASDVVVYVERDLQPRQGVDGRLTFLSAAGGRRYVKVRVVYLPDAARQIAILGHELRHAVEVADAPAIVDEKSMLRIYDRLGFERELATVNGRTFDTAAAVKAGWRVYRELTTGSLGD